MKKIKKIILTTLTVLMILGLTSLVVIPSVGASNHHLIDPGAEPPEITPEAAVTRIFNVAFWVLLLISGLFFLYGAYFFLLAGADQENLKKGKNVILYAIVAIILAFLARGLADFIPRMFEGLA